MGSKGEDRSRRQVGWGEGRPEGSSNRWPDRILPAAFRDDLMTVGANVDRREPPMGGPIQRGSSTKIRERSLHAVGSSDDGRVGVKVGSGDRFDGERPQTAEQLVADEGIRSGTTHRSRRLRDAIPRCAGDRERLVARGGGAEGIQELG